MLAAIAYPIFFVCFLAMEIVLVRQWLRNRDPFYLLAIVPALGLLWDSGMITLGMAIGEGNLLQSLNWVRYFAHGLLGPLFYIFGIRLANQSGSRWAGKPVLIGVGVIAALFIAAGVIGALNLTLKPVQVLGVLRYVENNAVTPPWVIAELVFASVVLMTIYLVAGIFAWKRNRWPWLFWGSLCAFLANSVPGESRFVFSSFGEIVWLLGVVATTVRFWKPNPVEPPAQLVKAAGN